MANPADAANRIYIAQDEPSKKALSNMLELLGYRLNTNAIPNKPVSGKFTFKNVDEVMSYFKGAFKVNWFQNGTQIYVYKADDWGTQKIYVGGKKTNDDWKDLLTSAGLYYKEFPFVIHTDSQELIVSGPRSYIKLVRDAFQQNPPDPSEIEKHGIELMVYPLRYASVEDRITTLRGVNVTTPGVLSVLLNLLGLPNQRMTGAPENKRAGVTADASGTQPPLQSFQQAGRISQLPSSSVMNQEGPEPEKDNATQEMPVSVTADPRTNAILIRDAKSKYDYYRVLIEQLDRPMPMIEVEAMLVEVDQKGLNELGLEFGFQSKNLLYDFPGGRVGVPSLVIPGSSTIVDPVRFLARLRALSADENAKVLARPTIVTQDNVAAFIDLSQTLYLQLTGERVAEVVPVTAGSLLQVTPRVVKEAEEDKVFLRIEIQDGNIASAQTDSRGIVAPSVQNTSLNTQAIIQKNKAILIGGYNRESATDSSFKVPLLSSIPVIGRAFTSVEKQTQTLSRLFLITPRIVEEPASNSPSTRAAIGTLQKSFNISSDNLQPVQSLQLDRTLERQP
ncbi:MAG TPA: type III secretion system outer membrane ring subunit SctC [Limnobacter sp.]|nr:type III secretion system outer membrane ring subunit SctC [Limnobacter sp.]